MSSLTQSASQLHNMSIELERIRQIVATHPKLTEDQRVRGSLTLAQHADALAAIAATIRTYQTQIDALEPPATLFPGF